MGRSEENHDTADARGTWRQQKDISRDVFMDREAQDEINWLMDTLNNETGEMQKLYAQWSLEDEAYSQTQPEGDKVPNSRVNIILPVIEGEITQIVDNNWAATATGEEPGDDLFADDALITLEWALNHNDLFKKMTVHERRRNKHGLAYIEVDYDHAFAGKLGCPKMNIVPIHEIIVDSKVKDFLRWQEQEYVARKIVYSRSYAIDTYGREKANAVSYGVDEWRDSHVFEEGFTLADEHSFTLLRVWSRLDGKLRKREISSCGLLLYDSAKEGKPKDNQKDADYTNEAMYKHVDNKYPIFITNKYTKEGRLQGFGDATILLPLQNLVNELYDKIRIQMRPNIIAVDKNSEIDISTFDEDSFEPVEFDGLKIGGRPPIFSIAWGAINADMFHLLQDIKLEAQRVARFNDMMTGQGKQADTATEAAIQQQQGNAHTGHEKTTIEHTLGDVCKYFVGLMMQYMTEGKAFRLFGERAKNAKGKKYAWVDYSKMTNVPGMVPSSQEYKDRYRKENPSMPVPEFEVLETQGSEGEEGQNTGTVKKVAKNKKKLAQTKDLEIDINFSMGSGLPKNKAFLWQMIEKLSQMTGIDTDSEVPIPKPLLSWKEMREFIKDYMDIPIESDNDMKEFMEKLKEMQNKQLQEKMPQTSRQVQGGGQSPQPQQGNADQNLTQGGNAQLAGANQAKTGGAF